MRFVGHLAVVVMVGVVVVILVVMLLDDGEHKVRCEAGSCSVNTCQVVSSTL